MSTDRIEKKILLRARKHRVWRALSDSTEFGTWFGVKFEGPFVPGASARGVLVTTSVDSEVAKAQAPYKGMTFEIIIEQWNRAPILLPLASLRSRPQRRLLGRAYYARRLHPRGSRRRRHAHRHRVRLRSHPASAPRQGFSANEGGWSTMVKVIEKYVVHEP